MQVADTAMQPLDAQMQLGNTQMQHYVTSSPADTWPQQCGGDLMVEDGYPAAFRNPSCKMPLRVTSLGIEVLAAPSALERLEFVTFAFPRWPLLSRAAVSQP
jgi:hypothetical protein